MGVKYRPATVKMRKPAGNPMPIKHNLNGHESRVGHIEPLKTGSVAHRTACRASRGRGVSGEETGSLGQRSAGFWPAGHTESVSVTLYEVTQVQT